MQVAKDIPLAVRALDSGSGHPVAPLSMDAVCEKVGVLVLQNAVVVFTISGYCMCHMVKQLLFGLGVGPTMFQLDCDTSSGKIHALLARLSGRSRWCRLFLSAGSIWVASRRSWRATSTAVWCLLKNAGALWV